MENRPALFGFRLTSYKKDSSASPLPPPASNVFTHSSFFKFYANDMTERDVSRPAAHRSLPKHLITKIIQSLYVAHNKAQEQAGKGVWLRGRLTDPDRAGPH